MRQYVSWTSARMEKRVPCALGATVFGAFGEKLAISALKHWRGTGGADSDFGFTVVQSRSNSRRVWVLIAEKEDSHSKHRNGDQPCLFRVFREHLAEVSVEEENMSLYFVLPVFSTRVITEAKDSSLILRNWEHWESVASALDGGGRRFEILDGNGVWWDQGAGIIMRDESMVFTWNLRGVATKEIDLFAGLVQGILASSVLPLMRGRQIQAYLSIPVSRKCGRAYFANIHHRR